MTENCFYLENKEATIELAKGIANFIKKSFVIGLSGEMGVGKTTFSQAFAKQLGIKEVISSPTFTMLNEYHSGRVGLYHFDFYRIQEDIEINSDAIQMFCMELEELKSKEAVILVEWIDLFSQFLHLYEDLRLKFEYLAIETEERRLFIDVKSNKGEEALGFLKKNYLIHCLL